MRAISVECKLDNVDRCPRWKQTTKALFFKHDYDFKINFCDEDLSFNIFEDTNGNFDEVFVDMSNEFTNVLLTVKSDYGPNYGPFDDEPDIRFYLNGEVYTDFPVTTYPPVDAEWVKANMREVK